MNLIKNIFKTIGLVGSMFVGALIGFAIGIFVYWFIKIFIGLFASSIDTAPFIESIIYILYNSEYSDLIQYFFIGCFTILVPISWYLKTD